MAENTGKQETPVVVVPKKLGDLHDANFPIDAEGRVYHLGVKRGEVCNRILSVGDQARAASIAGFLDGHKTNFERASTRGFVIHTGKFNGVPITIIATGMGMPMMDFVVRECRAIVDGPMYMLRFGTCGTPQVNIPVGSFVVAKSSVAITRNLDSFLEENAEDNPLKHYNLSKPVDSNEEIVQILKEKLDKTGKPTFVGSNASADSFYCSQGRIGKHFEDKNETLVDAVLNVHPDLSALEMESYHLLHLARCSKGSVKAAAATIVLAQRKTNDFLSSAAKVEMEKLGGKACLETLAALHIDDNLVMKGEECVWLK
eukprot:TRINITY_DN3831_c0_g1_i1.p1 TRINITY_DN3831_c0_g1~~TRINITY_DN3831_c0_g1_i1.p1  ORF type:complete len:315 (+),score=82.98 TRINITY_DN3831_c0_g1_i1:181-1125(+)